MLRHSTQKINNCIFICGCGRSGTSIMGSLIASHKNVQYCYDPPLLHRLIYFTRNLNSEGWQELFESYLYTDVFMGAIAGRNLNFNRYDQSYVLHYKSKEEIESRLDRVARRAELADEAKKHTLCVKVTDALLQIKYIKTLYPGMRFIVMCRNANDTITSIVKQGWFSDKSISNTLADNALPMRIYQGVNVALWVEDEEVDFWVAATEIERATMYYVKLNSILLENMRLAIVVNYDKFVKCPQYVAKMLRKVLKLEEGEKTKDIIETITDNRKQIEYKLLSVSGELRDRAEAISSQLDSLIECPLIGSSALT